jgi:DNA-binding transcriptional LysR family regulator
MSAEECRANAERCERMAESLGPKNAGLRDTMREVAAQWRQLAADAEARDNPAVSKQIAALEAYLGAQLLQRTSRSLTLTEAGRDFYESAVRVLSDVEAAESRVGRGRIAPSGLVRATVAPVFGRLYILPRLREFFARYPEVAIELARRGQSAPARCVCAAGFGRPRSPSAARARQCSIPRIPAVPWPVSPNTPRALGLK